MAIPFRIGEIFQLTLGEGRNLVAKAVQSAVLDVGSAAELARRCKVSYSTILQLQKGHCRPCKRTFYRLFKFIGKFLPEDVWIGLADSRRSRIIIRRKTINSKP